MTRTAILPTLLCFLDLVSAVRFGVHGRSSFQQDGRSIQNRAPTGLDTLVDAADLSYYADLLLDGSNFSVLVDTGSSDLWVADLPPSAQSTGQSAVVTYASGPVSGQIFTAVMDVLGYVVPKQAFMVVPGKPLGSGLIGLGPSTGSQIESALGTGAGNTVLNNIFLQNTTTPNYLTVLLGRSNDPNDPYPGDITIGEVVPGFNNITSQPQLPVTVVPTNDQGNQHWQMTIDKDGIIGPDGKPIYATSVVNGSPNLTAVMDSGFSLPQVPRMISDAIYSRIPGSSFQTISQGIGGVWTLPCNTEVNITFNVGGVSFPINPQDTSLAWNQAGNLICIGAFQPMTLQSPTFDMILGMAFLRNAYMLINNGDFVQGKAGSTAPPFIQLLSTTVPAEVHADFVSMRLNGIDTTGSQSLLPNTTPSGPYNSAAPSNNSSQISKLAIIGISIGLGILLVLLLWYYCRRRTRTRGSAVGGYSSYRALEEPAPFGDDHYEFVKKPV